MAADNNLLGKQSVMIVFLSIFDNQSINQSVNQSISFFIERY